MKHSMKQIKAFILWCKEQGVKIVTIDDITVEFEKEIKLAQPTCSPKPMSYEELMAKKQKELDEMLYYSS